MRISLALAAPVLVLALAGCANLFAKKPDDAAGAEPALPAAPAVETAVIAPPASAKSAEEFDTTSEAERQAAAAAPATGGKLGTTIASLGDPAAPGFWLETPLVTETKQGHVVLPASGASAKVELRPIDGPASGGSRISLAALRLLGVSLTDLPEIEVYAD